MQTTLKATFARYMYLEARRLSQIHVAEQLLDEWDSGNRTLHSDGTSKHGYHYATFDATLDNGNGHGSLGCETWHPVMLSRN